MEMPTYEFRCPEGHEFEKFYRSIGGAESQAACPTCGEVSERMMSATGFAFKGSGFYLTDYGKNAHRDKGTPSPTSGEGKGGAGGESGKRDGATGDGATGDGATGDGAKGDGAKGDGAKGDGARGDAAPSSATKGDSSSSSSSRSAASSGIDSAKSAPAATPKPAAPAKQSKGE
jgi:putative FmdB family regulatory protein